MPPKLSPLKAGSTFSYAGTCKLPPGNWTATCQLRSACEPFALIGTIAVTLGAPLTNGDTPIALRAEAAQTLTWPADQHELDIRYADAGGEVIHTSTVTLPVTRAVTLPAAQQPATD
ncbi:MAG: hypothetical protein ACKVOT_13870 [Polaromonas sp.]